MIRQQNSNRKNEKRKKAIVIILILLALLFALFFILRGCSGLAGIKSPEVTPVYLDDEGSSITGEAENASREDILEALEKQQLVVTDKLSSNISFDSGSAGTIGEWVVENPEENKIIQQAEVYLEDTLIAKSTPIYPNQHIMGVSLLTDVESGEYEVTAYLNYYDIETKEFISKAGYKIHLTVR